MDAPDVQILEQASSAHQEDTCLICGKVLEGADPWARFRGSEYGGAVAAASLQVTRTEWRFSFLQGAPSARVRPER
eukprot:4773722-Alexandrium_andersonii.AAC.1